MSKMWVEAYVMKEVDQVLRHLVNINFAVSKTSSHPLHLYLKSLKLPILRRWLRQDGSRTPKGLIVRLGEKKERMKKKRERKKEKKKKKKKFLIFF